MSAVDTILGVPFRLHGRDRTGLDCYGVALWLARAWGIRVPDLSDVLSVASHLGAIDALDLPAPHGIAPISLASARRGDLVWLWDTSRRRVNHVEIVETPGRSVTALLGCGVRRVVWSAAWRRRVHSVWRCPCSG